MVEAVEKEISIRQELDHMIEKVPAPRVDSSNRRRRMKTCERGWKGGDLQERKCKNSQEKDPRTFEENSQGKDPSTFEGRSHQVERWLVQEKGKEGKWKKWKNKKTRKGKGKRRKR